MATLFRYSSVFLLAFFILFLTVLSLRQDDHEQIHGVVTLDMIHRDSPASPLYNASETHWQRLRNSLQRSRSGVQRYKSGKAQDFSLIFSEGEYLVNISIGTPPRPFIGIVDTGSDLIWTQCTPCKDCFKQKIPLFNPASSSTYKALSCASKQCRLLMEPVSCSGTQSCPYYLQYVDNSYTVGNLSLDTIGLGSLSVPDTMFGCGNQNGGLWSGVESGIVGLGTGPLSLVSQIGKLIGGRCFSHCLVPTLSALTNPNISSKMHLGRRVSGPGVVSVPLLTNGNDPFYYLELQGISVGSNRFTPHVNSSQAFKGNIFIDSGTTVTVLPTDLYTSFEAEIRKKVHLEVVKDPDYLLCYKTKNDIANVTVTFHFNGADVKLQPDNIFVRVNEDAVCLAVVRSTSDLGIDGNVGIYGNAAMTNFLVEYDLERKIMSFKSSDCMSQ